MITRQTSSDQAVVIESRLQGGWRQLVLLALAVTIAASVLILEFNAIGWAVSREVSWPVPTWLYLYASVPLAVALYAPRALAGSERMELSDKKFIYSRHIAGMQTFRVEFDLLRMKGLETIASVGPMYQATPGIRFWYVSGFEQFGYSLSHSESKSVVEQFVAYDVKVRQALGLDSALGLADTRYWRGRAAREAMLQEAYSDQRFLG